MRSLSSMSFSPGTPPSLYRGHFIPVAIVARYPATNKQLRRLVRAEPQANTTEMHLFCLQWLPLLRENTLD